MNEDEKAIWNAAFGATVAQVWMLYVTKDTSNSWASALMELDGLNRWVTPIPAMVADKAVKLYREKVAILKEVKP